MFAWQRADGERVFGMHRWERIRFHPPTWPPPGAPGGAAETLTRTEDANKNPPSPSPASVIRSCPDWGEAPAFPNVPLSIPAAVARAHTDAPSPPPLRPRPSSCSPNQKATRSSHHVSLVISLCLWLPLFPSSTFTLISSFSFI